MKNTWRKYALVSLHQQYSRTYLKNIPAASSSIHKNAKCQISKCKGRTKREVRNTNTLRILELRDNGSEYERQFRGFSSQPIEFGCKRLVLLNPEQIKPYRAFPPPLYCVQLRRISHSSSITRAKADFCLFFTDLEPMETVLPT